MGHPSRYPHRPRRLSLAHPPRHRPDAEFLFLDDERYDAPEAPGLETALRGLSMIGDDQHTLTVAKPLFDGVYEHYRRAALLGREPA